MVSIFLDIEANGLLNTVDTIWCISIKNINTNDEITFCDETHLSLGTPTLEHFKKWINSKKYPSRNLESWLVDEIIGHNIICYDIPVMEKVLGIDFSRIKLIDTLVMSRRLDPDRDMKRHSVEDWARRLGGETKVAHEVWDRFDRNMLVRCQSDVRLVEKIYYELLLEIKRNEERWLN